MQWSQAGKSKDKKSTDVSSYDKLKETMDEKYDQLTDVIGGTIEQLKLNQGMN